MPYLTSVILALGLILGSPGMPMEETGPFDDVSVSRDTATVKVRVPGSSQTRPSVPDERSGGPGSLSKVPDVPCTPDFPGVCAVLLDSGVPRGGVSVVQVAREAAASLRVPAPVPVIGPDPQVNEWKFVAVGYPLWLWTEHADVVSTSVSSQGIVIGITARRVSTSFDMGDGSTVVCRQMSRYPGAMNPPRPSPDCGHTYLKLPKTPGSYSVVASASWEATWSAQGMSGTVMLTSTASRDVPIGELQSVLVPRR